MIKNKIQPLFDNVLIRPLEAEAKTASGIILPETAQEKPQMGEIVAVGPGKVTPKGEKEPIVVAVGQKVMYKKWGGNEVKLNGEELILVEQKDILAIIEEDKMEAIKGAVQVLKKQK
jgi:chaperonin GroES